MPVYPAPGGRMTFSMVVWSQANATTAPATVKFYANSTAEDPCALNQPPDATLAVPPLEPFQVKSLKLKLTAPKPEGRGTLRWCFDEGATADIWYTSLNYEVARSKAAAELGVVSTDLIEDFYTQMAPSNPVAGSDYRVSFGVTNYGTAAATNMTVAVWGSAPFGVVDCGAQVDPPPKVVALPRIAPGSTYWVRDLAVASGAGYNW